MLMLFILRKNAPMEERERRAREDHDTYVTFWVDLHLRHRVVEFHVLLPDAAAVLDPFDAFPQAVLWHGPAVDGDLRDEGDAGARDERLLGRD